MPIAIPPDYIEAIWSCLRVGDQVYLVDDKLYGPYTVEDEAKHLVRDSFTVVFEIKPHEVMAVPIKSNIGQVMLSAAPVSTNSNPSTHANPYYNPNTAAPTQMQLPMPFISAQDAVDTFFEFVAAQAAVKANNIAPSTLATYKAEAQKHRDKLIKLFEYLLAK